MSFVREAVLATLLVFSSAFAKSTTRQERESLEPEVSMKMRGTNLSRVADYATPQIQVLPYL